MLLWKSRFRNCTEGMLKSPFTSGLLFKHLCIVQINADSHSMHIRTRDIVFGYRATEIYRCAHHQHNNALSLLRHCCSSAQIWKHAKIFPSICLCAFFRIRNRAANVEAESSDSPSSQVSIILRLSAGTPCFSLVQGRCICIRGMVEHTTRLMEVSRLSRLLGMMMCINMRRPCGITASSCHTCFMQPLDWGATIHVIDRLQIGFNGAEIAHMIRREQLGITPRYDVKFILFAKTHPSSTYVRYILTVNTIV